jgi:hypothetical protein
LDHFSNDIAPEASMAISPIARKLQLKPGYRINAPDGFPALVAPLPAGARLDQGVDDNSGDAVHLFVTSSVELRRDIPSALAALKSGGLLWVSYPKKSSGVETDLTRDVGWESIKDGGWEPVRQVSLDETWSALRFRPVEHDTEDDALAAQYGGAKAHLRPILDSILGVVEGFGPDVSTAVRKSYVALVRGKQFANVVPSTRDRVDLVLKLPGAKVEGRLQPAGNIGSGSMTHKIELVSVDGVDPEFIDWLRQAYEGAT